MPDKDKNPFRDYSDNYLKKEHERLEQLIKDATKTSAFAKEEMKKRGLA